MRVLLDQATPVPIRPYLKGHDVRTAAQQGWDKLKNGELLVAAEADGFDVLLATDKNMRYQQNLAGRKIAVVVLGRQQWPSVRSHVRLIVEAVNAAVPGSYTEIDQPAGAAVLPRSFVGWGPRFSALGLLVPWVRLVAAGLEVKIPTLPQGTLQGWGTRWRSAAGGQQVPPVSLRSRVGMTRVAGWAGSRVRNRDPILGRRGICSLGPG